jgi:hypothetical protein
MEIAFRATHVQPAIDQGIAKSPSASVAHPILKPGHKGIERCLYNPYRLEKSIVRSGAGGASDPKGAESAHI